MDEAEEFDEFEELLVADREVAVDGETHAGAAVEHGLGQGDVVAVEEPVGGGRIEDVKDVVVGQVGVEAAGDFIDRDLVLEGNLVQDVGPGDGVDEIGFADDGVIFTGEDEDLRA